MRSIEFIFFLAIALLILLMMKNSSEQFITCTKKDSQIPNPKWGVKSYAALLSKCGANALDTSNINNLSDEEIAAREMKCMQSCYIDDDFNDCKEKCDDKNSQECKDCLHAFACQTTWGDEFALPCDMNSVPRIVDDKYIDFITSWLHRDETCDSKCGFGDPNSKAIKSKQCRACIGEENVKKFEKTLTK